ncbi:MAG: hypothetical protein NTX03_02315 [Bacteroidetes bacterium]|nr:hypothetical protein [Bacteroidota bacterium]
MQRYLKENSVYFLVPLVCFLLYSGLIVPGHFQLELTPKLNYFRHLADAFLNGRLDIINPPSKTDLVIYHGKYFIYWPPVPALVFVPLVALFGVELPDILISCLFAAINVWLLMLICKNLSEKFSLGLTQKHIAWIGIFWGLGTVHFYMAKEGDIWFISQIMAQTFLFAAVYFFLRKGNGYLILSGLFFAMAAYTRNHLVFSIFFFLFLFIAMEKNVSIKDIFIKGFVFVLPFVVFSFLNLWYNYARFGSLFDNGINYHNMNPYFVENFKKFGYFSWHYFPHNFYTEVLHFPHIRLHPNFLEREEEGFGFIWGSPLYFLLIPALVFRRKNYDMSTHLIKTGSMISAILIACLIFLIMGTGWIQFCARYTLDFQFFLIIFLLFSWKNLSGISFIKPITICLILLSLWVQYVGAWVR